MECETLYLHGREGASRWRDQSVWQIAEAGHCDLPFFSIKMGFGETHFETTYPHIILLVEF